MAKEKELLKDFAIQRRLAALDNTQLPGFQVHFSNCQQPEFYELSGESTVDSLVIM